MKTYMVFDFGGTSIKYAVMDEEANKLANGKFPTPKEGLETFLKRLCTIVEEYSETYKLQGIALSSPGAVDIKTGVIGGASAIPYINEESLTDHLKKMSGLPVSVENDANCAALAEGWRGAAKDADYYICIVIGTGIGGSIVLNRSILRGASLHGGEFGYMIMGGENIEGKDPLQSTWSLSTSTNALVRAVERKKSLEIGSLDGEEVFRMAKAGDPIAQEMISQFYKKLAIGIYNLKYALDPQKILIGGGISKRREVIEGINQELALLKDNTSTLQIEVEACQFDNDANLIGALFHYLRTEWRK
ncbi:Sugar kinase of the NBD/HSP70 family, may contain an N-terminal HTH domain [Fictibacillus solisalsi]|uniref:Sugar kinase of the NBD/HSP70 family, may contain an N-terminal HTH domain n=1 Tax=Fictibacillus solisalsi TaxID=459525 RepID=A0A1G9YGE8_9BACL|nr:ROK family protein [Fictibacillus solisalsi]SDN08107.1 Sugar kinase of the NBD/HSP70 family, may contain an N-terminal HTH domain [Fictibacillus solisalsi]